MADIRFIVKRYLGEGRVVLPVRPGEKATRFPLWPTATPTVEDFSEDDNVAERLDNVVDVDNDTPEARAAAVDLLLTTERKHGRPSVGIGHYFFDAPGSKPEVFKDVDGQVLVEIRTGNNQYTIIPPSILPRKDDATQTEQLTWDKGDDRPLAHVDTKGLRESVLHVATVALLARHWPKGSRHVCSGLAAGFLAARGLDPATVERLIKTAATIAGDDEVEDRRRYARETAEKFKKVDVPVAGGPQLAEHLGDAVFKRLREWYGVGQDTVMDEMNAKHFAIRIGSDTVYATEEDGDTVFQSRTAMSEWYANQRVKTGTKPKKDKEGKESGETISYKSKFEIWREHPARRGYRTITFAPQPIVPHPQDYNLWKGFAVEPAAGCCDLFLEHARGIICGGSDEYFRYLLDLLALGVQQPGVQSEIATILRGPQGAGKGVFIRAYGSLFGKHFAHLDKPEQLTGKFNAHLSGKVVVFADEAFFAGDRSIDGPLKRLITEPTLQIERKGIDQYEERNCIHLFMATNREWAVGSEFKERRHFVLDVAETKSQDHNYFEPLVHEIENGGRAALLKFLLERPIDRKALRRAPDTAALRDQQNFSLGTEFRWWKERLTLGEVFPNEGWPTFLPSDDVHLAYVLWCDTMKINRRVTQTELTKRLRRVIGETYGLTRQMCQNRDHFGKPDGLAGKIQKRGMVLRCLETCRERFDAETLGRTQRTAWPDVRESQVTEEPTEREPGEDDDIEF